MRFAEHWETVASQSCLVLSFCFSLFMADCKSSFALGINWPNGTDTFLEELATKQSVQRKMMKLSGTEMKWTRSVHLHVYMNVDPLWFFGHRMRIIAPPANFVYYFTILPCLLKCSIYLMDKLFLSRKYRVVITKLHCRILFFSFELKNGFILKKNNWLGMTFRWSWV